MKSKHTKMFVFLSKVKHCFVSYFHRFIEIFLTTFGEFTGSAYQLYKLQCPLVFVSGNILLALARQKCCPVQFVRYRFYYLNIFRVSVVSYSHFYFIFLFFWKHVPARAWMNMNVFESEMTQKSCGEILVAGPSIWSWNSP